MNTRYLLLVSGLLVAASVAPASPLIYQVTVNLPTVNGSGYIDFQFNQANAGTSLSATAEVSNFQSSGFTFSGVTDRSSSSVTGSLPASVVIPNDATAANYYSEGVTQFGSTFSFLVTLSGDALNGGALDGSGFYVSILDDTFAPQLGTLPNGELANILINGDGSISINGSDYVTIALVPEPGSIALLAAAVSAVAWRSRGYREPSRFR